MMARGNRSRDAAAAKERRALGNRVQFEAMVAVGGAEGGAAFEAESVDVSGQGMRLRTAYLPDIGEQLVCRFDGPEGEIVLVGEVLWATSEEKGGEFGLRFVDLDAETEAQLKAFCAEDVAAEEPMAPPSPPVSKGARVRLHIEGLASPMKARVRSADSKEIAVGSSLEFLKLGRTVAVEDVDAGQRREGFVDGVKVEVDPTSSVPQLVVSLRFDAAEVGLSAARAKPSKEVDAEAAPSTKVTGAPIEKAAEIATKAVSPKKDEAPASAPKSAAKSQAAKVAVPAVDSDAEPDAEEAAMLAPNKLRVAQERAKEMTSKAAQQIGPTFSKLGKGARGLLASISGTIQKRREARDEAKRASAPKRVTAPPPSGALTSEGRRVVRQGQDGADEEEAPKPVAKPKRGLMIGAVAGVVVVLGAVGMSKALSGGGPETAAKAPASAEVKPAVGLPPIPGAAATADVPLFGATPLSTVVQVPKAPVVAKTAEPSEEAGDDEPAEKSELVREWGQGELSNSKTLKMKLDGPIEGFSAKEIEGGFTLTVPKRKSLSTSSALMRKDKRLSAVDVINNQDGVEITIKFKGEPPAYKAKVRSDRIEIALGGEGGTKKADKKPDAKKVAAKPKKKKKTEP